MNKRRTRSQQPTCDFLWGLKTSDSFQIPRDGASSFEHPHELPQLFTLLLQLLLLLLALLLGQTHGVHAEMENFGSAGVVVALGGRKKQLNNWFNLQAHPTCTTQWNQKMLQQKIRWHLCSDKVLFQQLKAAKPSVVSPSFATPSLKKLKTKPNK